MNDISLPKTSLIMVMQNYDFFSRYTNYRPMFLK